ncbi:MAG: ERCC4 domain-containing protein [Thermodesulfobacteriota bacterium]
MPKRSTPILLPEVVLTVDTREPEHTSWERFFSLPSVRQKMDTADYGILGVPDVGIERKTATDLAQCLSWERDRFCKELERSRALRFFRVIVECDARSFLQGRYGERRSRVNPDAIWESLASFTARYNTRFLFASDAPTAARMCQSLLTKWLRENWNILEAVRKANADHNPSRTAVG